MRFNRRTSRIAQCGAVIAAFSLLAACSSSGGSSGGSSTSAAGGSSAPATTASSAAQSSAPAIASGPIKVGIIAALSGNDAAIGGLTKALYGGYTTYINKHGGIAGHQVQLIVENNQSDPTVAVSVAQKLIKEGVVATFYNGSTAEAKDQVVALEQRAKIIGISPEGLDQYDNASKYPYYFNDNASDRHVTDALASYAKQRNFDDIGVLSDGSPQANDYLTQFGASTKASGLKVVKSTSYPTGATTMTTQLSSLKEAGTKTLALFCYSGCGQVMDSLRQIKWKPNILVSPNIYYTAFSSVKDYGDVTYSGCPYSVEKGAQPPAGVVAAIKALSPAIGGENPLDQLLPETADGFSILKWAIEKAKSTNANALKSALETMTNTSFSDPAVQFTFSAQHHAGYTPGTSNKLMPICGFSSLGALQMPVRVSS